MVENQRYFRLYMVENQQSKQSKGQVFIFTVQYENVVKFIIYLSKDFIQALDKIMKTVYFIKNLIGTDKITIIEVCGNFM